jgi:hypothetical protein
VVENQNVDTASPRAAAVAIRIVRRRDRNKVPIILQGLYFGFGRLTNLRPVPIIRREA